MFGNHAQFGDGKAVISRAGIHGRDCFVTCEFYVMAEVWFEINAAGGDLENLTTAVFRNRVIAIRSTQATFDVGRIRVAASVGSLRKPKVTSRADTTISSNTFFMESS